MKRALIACLLLAGCATTSEPKIVVKEVRVPVPVACPDKRPPAPVYVDTLDAIREAASQGPDALVALLLGGREQRIAREEASDAQIRACSNL